VPLWMQVVMRIISLITCPVRQTKHRFLSTLYFTCVVPISSQNIVNSQKASSSAQASQLPRSSSSSQSQSTAFDRASSSNPTLRRSEEFRSCKLFVSFTNCVVRFNPWSSASRMSLSETSLNSHDDQEHVHERERGWNRRKPLSRSQTPEPSERSSHVIPSTKSPTSTVKKSLSRRGSSASLGSFDGRPWNRSSVAFPSERECNLHLI
jgi:hypothetical protein